jgi:hypothetical protein
MTQPTPCLFVEERTAEELAELRLKTLEGAEYGILRALRARGTGTASWAGCFIACVDKNYCANRCAVDPEHPGPTRPRVRQFDVLCPLCGERSSLRKVCDGAMKSPAKRMKFLERAQPNVAPDPDWVVLETGADFERLGVGLNSQAALADAGANLTESVRVCLIRCRSMARAAELADEKRGEISWVTGLRRRADGSLDAGWHGGPLRPGEARLLKAQQDEDRAAKRGRRDRVIRDMQREVI